MTTHAAMVRDDLVPVSVECSNRSGAAMFHDGHPLRMQVESGGVVSWCREDVALTEDSVFEPHLPDAFRRRLHTSPVYFTLSKSRRCDSGAEVAEAVRALWERGSSSRESDHHAEQTSAIQQPRNPAEPHHGHHEKRGGHPDHSDHSDHSYREDDDDEVIHSSSASESESSTSITSYSMASDDSDMSDDGMMTDDAKDFGKDAFHDDDDDDRCDD